MLRQPVFYVLLLMLTCGATFGMMVISNAGSMAVNIVGVSASTASVLVSVLSQFNTAGRLVAGSLSDRLGRIITLTGAMILAVLGLSALMMAERSSKLALFIAGVVLVGICYGTFMGVFPGFCTDQFGTRYNTVNYGIMFVGFSLAGIIGPMTLSGMYASMGRYLPALLLACALVVLGIGLSFVYRAMQKT